MTNFNIWLNGVVDILSKSDIIIDNGLTISNDESLEVVQVTMNSNKILNISKEFFYGYYRSISTSYSMEQATKKCCYQALKLIEEWL